MAHGHTVKSGKCSHGFLHHAAVGAFGASMALGAHQDYTTMKEHVIPGAKKAFHNAAPHIKAFRQNPKQGMSNIGAGMKNIGPKIKAGASAMGPKIKNFGNAVKSAAGEL